MTVKAFVKTSLLFLLAAISTRGQAVQSKACVRPIITCSFTNPVASNALIVASHVSGGVASDSNLNSWKTALIVPNWNGIWLDYALNAKGGYTDVLFTPNTWWAIIAEYPPAVALDKVKFGTYTYQNTALGGQNGGSYDNGWTLPIETEEPCELLIEWGVSGTYDLSALHGRYFPLPTPHFTIRESEYNMLALADAWATVPGVYVGALKWNIPGHWDLGLAAFKMGNCK